MPRFWKHLLLFGLGAACCVLGYLFLLNLPAISRQSSTAGIIPSFALALGAVVLTIWALRADHVRAAALGLSPVQPRVGLFGLGFVAGTVLPLGWCLAVAITTGGRWHLNPAFSPTVLLGAIGFVFFNNLAEELVYRGYAFERLVTRYGTRVAVLSTSALFALLHWQSGIPLSSVLAGVFTSALVFAAVFARWRSLPLTLGVHVAMNVIQDASGLRPGAGSIFTVVYPSTRSPTEAPLLAVGLLNLVVAGVVLVYGQRMAAFKRENTE